MDEEGKRDRLRSFVLGSIVGASAALAAGRRRRRQTRQEPAGLAAFESAPGFRELIERDGSSDAT